MWNIPHKIDKNLINQSIFLSLIILTILFSFLSRVYFDSYTGVRLNCFYIISSEFYHLLNIFILSLLLFFSLKRIRANLIQTLSFGLIIGGGAYNIIERLLIDCVLDYIVLFKYISLNVADFAIGIGVLTILVEICISFLMPKKLADVKRQNTDSF